MGDFRKNIFVGDNQNSYKGYVVTKEYTDKYKGNLPTFYTKTDGTKKICLTYFIIILYNENNLKIQSIVLTCMPNGELSEEYEPDVLSASKNRGKIRYNYTLCKYFRLLPDKPLRTKILIFDPDNEEGYIDKLNEIKLIYEEQELRKNNVEYQIK